ncbi:mitochondrial ubiquitin ligase activator of NFKB 1 [Micractinium conductrix]|uniref:Mitochondrial ubiquitin ligase activator of NFKB 1 n=1 Tax=Micractinium conductrix TaxID=554055 RepID=A0A2P6VF00_9CHLO|nr:mitochondrial ubiquitin ligase activator of NFKB 1 [Micractinium conductrix]|eukprot:PSC72658.1 mitochondrial ubiquitin ligase activator of NFKB 1 [Micractinium conductrix]
MCAAAAVLAPLMQAIHEAHLGGRALLALLALPLLWGTWRMESVRLLTIFNPVWEPGSAWLRTQEDQSSSNRPFHLVAGALLPFSSAPAEPPSTDQPPAAASSSSSSSSSPAQWRAALAAVLGGVTDCALFAVTVLCGLLSLVDLLAAAVQKLASLSLARVGVLAVSTPIVYLALPLHCLLLARSAIPISCHRLCGALVWSAVLAARTLSTDWWLGVAGAREPSMAASAVAFGQALAQVLAQRGAFLLGLLSRLARTLLAPCGHRVLCLRCTQLVRNSVSPLCPICREPIESFIKRAWD